MPKQFLVDSLKFFVYINHGMFILIFNWKYYLRIKPNIYITKFTLCIVCIKTFDCYPPLKQYNSYCNNHYFLYYKIVYSNIPSLQYINIIIKREISLLGLDTCLLSMIRVNHWISTSPQCYFVQNNIIPVVLGFHILVNWHEPVDWQSKLTL